MMTSSQTTIRINASLLKAAFLAALTVGMAGCGPTGSAPGVVSGRVTYNGTLLTGGSMTLYPVDGGPDFPIAINNDGTFSSSGVPEGEMQVTIETEPLKNTGGVEFDASRMPKPPPGAVKPEDMKVPDIDRSRQPTYMKIPPKYASVNTSGLTWKITKGANNKDFELTDN